MQKGERRGTCARKACENTPAVWFNTSTKKWYCGRCARKINEGGEKICTPWKGSDEARTDFEIQDAMNDKLDLLKVIGSSSFEFDKEWEALQPEWRKLARWDNGLSKKKERETRLKLEKILDNELKRRGSEYIT